MEKFKTYKAEGGEVEVKRFYLPITLETNCPCDSGTPCKSDISREYLSYPIINEWIDHSFYCEECDKFFEKKVRLNISIDLQE